MPNKSGLILHITLNKGQAKIQEKNKYLLFEDQGNKSLLKLIFGNETSFEYISQKTNYQPYFGNDTYNEVVRISRMIDGLHQSANYARPFSLNTQILWYLILHEIGICIKSNPKNYKKLFGDSFTTLPVIRLFDSLLEKNEGLEWEFVMNNFLEALQNIVGPSKTNLFLPNFSMANTESKLSTLLTLFGENINYYQSAIDCEGYISTIRLEGNANDWKLLLDHTIKLSKIFTDLKKYFDDLIPVLRKIYKTVITGDVDIKFWEAMFSSKDRNMSGWITAFSAYVQSYKTFILKSEFDWEKYYRKDNLGYNNGHFALHMSVLPFDWKLSNEVSHMRLVSGLLGLDYNSYISPKLGVAFINP